MDPDILFLVARMAKEIGPLYSHHTETQLLMPRMEVTWIDKAKKMGQRMATAGHLRMATLDIASHIAEKSLTIW